ncbi:MAG: flagellar FlbD family protein [Defluviitaleaceae bacterium]|nr:flagellar FlbD family protein [Defluviitaleaceae bacterium]
MITVTRLNDKEMVVNCELILSIEANPDTTITTTTGLKLIVKESVEDIIAKTKEYKKYIHSNI